ncbi:MAG: hypothetical protein M5U14_17625 [Acidimicrobiia bacterium]|nr:hypothetical protein [Acidimicrobiia bacterium]
MADRPEGRTVDVGPGPGPDVAGQSLVPVRGATPGRANLVATLAGLGETMPDDPEIRRSDVDAWGRSERVRSVARRLYDPVYRHWFRAEWEGLEHVPADGGALLVSNHSAPIPPTRR